MTRTTQILTFLLACGGALTAQGEEADQQAQLVEKRRKKLAAPFLQRADIHWFTDFDKARAAAKARGKVIFAYFTRSYSP